MVGPLAIAVVAVVVDHFMLDELIVVSGLTMCSALFSALVGTAKNDCAHWRSLS